MIELTSDHSAIAASIIANIILCFSIELQKYAKKQIIELALHGLPSVSVERLWKAAFSLFVVAECMYYVWYGLEGTTTMTPMGVYTSFANCVLPPLLYKSRSRSSFGTMCTMMGILSLIFVPAQETLEGGLILNDNLRKCLFVYLLICLSLCALRSYKPANCSLKLVANCGLSGLLGAISVGLIKVLTNKSLNDGSSCGLTGENYISLCDYITLGWALVLVIFGLQLVLLSETLEFFPIWQVVAHHHILFSIFMLAENVTVFHLYDQERAYAVVLACLAHLLVFIGVWAAAKPRLDIPASISSSELLPHLATVYNMEVPRDNHLYASHHADDNIVNVEQPRVNEYVLNEQRKELRLCCVQEAYCEMMSSYLKSQEGFVARKHPSEPCSHQAAEP